MSEDWLADVQKYVPDANPDVVAGIVSYCGIALRKRDSSLVAFSSPDEIGRVRERFLKKKLALTQSDALLDEAIAKVGVTMKGDRTKNRVTVYYLLAAAFNKLDLFLKASKAGASAGTASGMTNLGTGEAPAGVAAATSTVAAGVAGAGPSVTPVVRTSGSANENDGTVAGSRPGMAAGGSDRATITPDTSSADRAASIAAGSGPTTPYKPVQTEDAPTGTGFKWWPWLLLALAVVALILILRSCVNQAATEPAPPVGTAAGAVPTASANTSDVAATTPAAPAAAAPVGAGAIAEVRDNLPVVKVYFDIGKSAVSNDFSTAVGGVRDYISSHPTARVAVAGYSDPSGNAAQNAALSKQRAQGVASALEKAGIPAAAISLEKPASLTGSGTSAAESRRVEVTVKP